MTGKERILVATLLEVASDTFANHGCNDVPESWFEGWSDDEKIELDRKMHEANGDPEEHDPECVAFSDWWLMSYFADRIKEETDERQTL